LAEKTVKTVKMENGALHQPERFKRVKDKDGCGGSLSPEATGNSLSR
jgi:hypothetical protein